MIKGAALTALLYLLTNLPNYAVTYTFTGNLSKNLGAIQTGTTFGGSFSYSFPQVFDAAGFYYVMIGNFTVNIGTEIANIEAIPYTNENEPTRGIIEMKNKLDALPPDGPIGSDLGWDEFRISFGRFGDGGEYGNLGGRKVYRLAISLQDTSGNIFPDLGLPGGQMILDQFSSASLSIYHQESVGGWFSTSYGNLTSLVPVPEPSALSLLAVGLGALAMMRRRRS